jgi:ubiquinone/menaquinone biosynthesis C-methylase UbiE
VLHHIPNVEHVLAELARVLTPGGLALIREPIHSVALIAVKDR